MIEVQDNGSGISPANYSAVALKHHTSKLSSYSDIASLETFGFRGEALASLCALSTLSVITCQPSDVPKGSKLTFEPSGKLNGTMMVAAQKGTTVSVDSLFHNLPVRRRELERNIKREWNKVIALLNQYACIQTNLKFSVSQQPTKGKRILLFSTKGNPTTRENVINIFGAKTMTALVPLDLSLELQPSTVGRGSQLNPIESRSSTEVRVVGHVSRPSHGDGRQTPDRQMFFVNGRPCGLPQFAKIFNEVYRSYNSSQNPFILADIRLDTHLYDVNVSPDKRSILLHDQNDLLDTLRSSLVELFDSQDYSVPTSQLLKSKQRLGGAKDFPAVSPVDSSKFLSTIAKASDDSAANSQSGSDESENDASEGTIPPGRARTISSARSLSKDVSGQNLISRWVERKTDSRPEREMSKAGTAAEFTKKQNTTPSVFVASPDNDADNISDLPQNMDSDKPRPVQDFNKRLEESRATGTKTQREEPNLSASPFLKEVEQSKAALVAPDAAKAHPGCNRHLNAQTGTQPTTVIIGELDVTDILTSPERLARRERPDDSNHLRNVQTMDDPKPSFGNRLSNLFSARGRSQENQEELEQTDASDDDSTVSSQPDTSPDDKESQEGPGEVPELIHEAEPEESLFVSPEPTIGRGTATEGLTKLLAPEETEANDIPLQSKLAELRGHSFTNGVRKKDATLQMMHQVRTSESLIRSRTMRWKSCTSQNVSVISEERTVADLSAADAEEKLSLIISRQDFSKMRIIGQFNLGFIIAVRPAKRNTAQEADPNNDDEFFIIDQHATDEKYNFERLQATTVVQSQRLVHPKRLELTALEEEIVMQNISAIEANGFKVHVDTSGEQPVGSRCQILALPLSRETTFDLVDFEELVSLLGDKPTESKHIPRPSKVRKMFAMRACRSSIMIGKPLTHGQMETLVRHMGELDKPWNCPHGRPTMRHLCKLQAWDETGWKDDGDHRVSATQWGAYVRGE